MYRISIVSAALIVALGINTTYAVPIVYDDFEVNGDFNGIEIGRAHV